MWVRLLAEGRCDSITEVLRECSVGRERVRNSGGVHPTSNTRRRRADEIDPTLIDWFLTLSPWERLQASANWARLASLRSAEREDE